MITTVRVGDLFPDAAHIGHHLPVGSVLAQGVGPGFNTYTQRAPRTWVGPNAGRSAGDNLIDPYILMSPLYLRTMGTDEETVTLPPESAASLRWRLRDTALAAAERSGVPTKPVVALAESFGALLPRFAVGGVVSNNVDVKQLPMGSVVYAGHPDSPNHMTVWDVTERGMTHVFGPREERAVGQPVTIYSIPGLQEMDEPVVDGLALAKIAVRAYRLGKACQRQQSWCGVFDTTLMALGINDTLIASMGESLRGPGDEIERDQAVLLPEGSLLWWAWHNRTAFAVYVRDNAARNKAKTRRLFGYEDDQENSHERMTVIQVPEEEMLWRVTGWQLQQLPDGTRFRDSERGDMVLDDAFRASSAMHNYRHYAVTELAPC